jgi:hypothetical protein
MYLGVLSFCFCSTNCFRLSMLDMRLAAHELVCIVAIPMRVHLFTSFCACRRGCSVLVAEIKYNVPENLW